MAEGNATAFTRTICSICYEDLKPIIEDLQSISVCGHVFHELCLQQWFEYCTKGKNCPVCKQKCSKANVSRLYFQSIGDPNDRSSFQKPREHCQNPEELYNEVKRLEGKVSGLTSALEQNQKNFLSAMTELSTCKEQCKVEQTLKDETLKQKAAIQQLLDLKSKELSKSTLVCTRFQERCMALAKELASLKLATDWKLSEDEMLKLASLGNEVNSKATTAVLQKTLTFRQKKYTELMAKCSALAGGETRCRNNLEKANAEINKLKVRIQELELGIEMNDNIALRNLKAAKQATYEVNTFNSFDQASKTPKGKSFTLESNVNQAAECDILSSSTKKRKLDNLEDTNMQRIYPGATDGNYENKKTSEVSYKRLKPLDLNGAVLKFHSSIEDIKAGPPSMDHCNDKHVPHATPATKVNAILMSDSKNAKVPQECIVLDEPVLSFRKEASPAHIVSQPGGSCFSGGLLGPGGTKSHLGTWCKKSQQSTGQLLSGSSTRNGDLIAVGGDGRGGTIKILKSLNQSSTENKENPGLAKNSKNGAKYTSTAQQSNGCLQIEHFFRKKG